MFSAEEGGVEREREEGEEEGDQLDGLWPLWTPGFVLSRKSTRTGVEPGRYPEQFLGQSYQRIRATIGEFHLFF